MSDNKKDILVNVQNNLLSALLKEVEGKIVVVRGQKTLLDRDVAALYGVETKRVNEAVKNNPRKFLIQCWSGLPEVKHLPVIRSRGMPFRRSFYSRSESQSFEGRVPNQKRRHE